MVRNRKYSDGHVEELPCGCVLEYSKVNDGLDAFVSKIDRVCRVMERVPIDMEINWVHHIRVVSKEGAVTE